MEPDSIRTIPRRVAVATLAIVIVATLSWLSLRLGKSIRADLLAVAAAVQLQSTKILWFTWTWGTDVYRVSKSLEASLPYLTVAILLAVWRELFNLFPAVIKLIRSHAWLDAWRPIVAVCSAFFMLGIAGLSEPARAEPPRVTGQAIVLAQRLAPAASPPPTLPMIHFVNAGLEMERLGTRGLAVTADQREALGRFVQALAPCHAPPDDPVRIRVAGFASSDPFPRADSDDLNVRVANARALAVHQEIAALTADWAVSPLEPPLEFARFDEMERERDRRSLVPAGVETREQAAFQRTVVVDFLSAGSCDPVSIIALR